MHFGPEVGVGRPKLFAPVIFPWFNSVEGIAKDLRSNDIRGHINTPAHAHRADARKIENILGSQAMIDAVFTSPPYPNEKDYTRTTRLESVLLGFINSKAELQALKRSLLRSNTRTVYKGAEDQWVVDGHPTIQRIAAEIETRRIEMGKTSDFERLYARVTQLYFGGMAQHLAQLRALLRPGAHVAYVVGDQASYLRVFIPTGQLLAEIGETLGYEIASIDLFRTRLATATREQLREEVVVLRWPGSKKKLGQHYRFLPLGSGNELERSHIMREASENQKTANRYQQIMERIFFRHYTEGAQQVTFEREELASTAIELNIKVPLDLGDIPYSFRYRQELPESIRAKATPGKEWTIRSIGRSQYQFSLRDEMRIVPTVGRAETKVPDATPGIVSMYALNDEQALLARLRYNRLVDIFTSVTCYSLQNHLRTTVPNIGQVETDELYMGVDKRGAHYVFPVQAKGKRDKLNITQIEQDFALCEDRFPRCICRPIGAQFMADDVIVLFEFEKQDDVVKIAAEKHYRLVPSKEISEEDLRGYGQRAAED